MSDTSNKVEFEVNSETNIPIWNTDEGVILGLSKANFINEDTKENRPESKKQFFLYMVEFKNYRIAMFSKKVEDLEVEKAEYIEKAANVGRELSPKEKAEAKLARAKKAYEAQMKVMEAMDTEEA